MSSCVSRKCGAFSWRISSFLILAACGAALHSSNAFAQVTIGGLNPSDAVCTRASDGALLTQTIAGQPDACDEENGASTTSGTSDGTITATAGAGNTTTINGGDITSSGTISGSVGSFSTLTAGATTTTGLTNTGDIKNSGDVETATLHVTGASTTNGITNSGNIQTTTLSVTGASETNGITNTGNIINTGNVQTSTLQTTGNASVGGNLTVTGTSSYAGAATFNGGATVNQSLTVGAGASVSMGNNVVHDVATPIVATDAANKGYVDAGLNEAFKKIDQNTEGIAVAIALGGLALPDSKNFALGANLGFFGGKEAVAGQAAVRLDQNVTLSGGLGVGLDSSQVGGRVGVMTAW